MSKLPPRDTKVRENMIPDEELNLSAEVQALKQGELIVYPTEAVWGIGCDPKNVEAVTGLLKAKQRPLEKGLILIAKDYSQLLGFIDDNKIPTHRRAEVLSSWPGAVTWLLPAAKSTPDWLTGGSELIAVRVTNHPTVRRMCEEFSGAIVSTSANITGTETSTQLSEIKQVFKQQVSVYVDEPLGGNRQASTIINSITGQVLRG